MFYEIDQSSPVQDVLASFITSLVSTTPGFIIRKMFEYSKPREEQFTHQPSLSGAHPGFEGTRSRSSSNLENNIETVIKMRKKFYEWMFPVYFHLFLYSLHSFHSFCKQLPSYCRIVGWIVLIIWSIGASVTAIVYGLSFDINPTAEPNEQNSNWEKYQEDCWNSSLVLRIENGLSIEGFNSDYQERQEMNESSYGGSDTGSWLLSLFQSLMLSIFIWQPLVMMIWTLLCVWMFTWNLPISIPWKLPDLCRRCWFVIMMITRSDSGTHSEFCVFSNK